MVKLAHRKVDCLQAPLDHMRLLADDRLRSRGLSAALEEDLGH
jgi:hypothetical protein